MSVYPGNKLEIIDGSLQPITILPTDTVVIVDRAYSGPSDGLFLVRDIKQAAKIFNQDSPLIRGAYRAVAEGAENIALYRFGGREASYKDIFGTFTTFSTTAQSKTAGADLSVYIGPSGTNATQDCVVVFRNDRVVYSNTLVSPIDTNQVILDGFQVETNDVYAGTPSTPVPFNTLLNELGSFKNFSGIITAQEATLTAGYDHSTTSLYSINVTLDGRKVDNARVTFPAGRIRVTGATDGQAVVYTYVTKFTPVELATRGITYLGGDDLMTATNKELFQGLYDSLESLSVENAKVISFPDLHGIPTLASGSTATDKLDYLNISVDPITGNNVYEWSVDRVLYVDGMDETATTTDPTLAKKDQNGVPVVSKRFGEFDFVHTLGQWAFKQADEGVFPNLVIGTVGPKNFSARAVLDWVGYAPVYDDATAEIIVPGKGLLGNRYMVGDMTYPGGYFATDDGSVDGTILADSTGFLVDLGKFLSIVASHGFSVLPTSVASGAANYSGIVASTTPGDSTTNRGVDGFVLATRLKTPHLKALSSAGYVVFGDKLQKGVYVVSGDLATRENSDYDYISTSLVISEVARNISVITDPFIGRGLDAVTRTALNTALTSRLTTLQQRGMFTSSRLSISQPGPNSLQVIYAIGAKDELREIVNQLKLTRTV